MTAFLRSVGAAIGRVLLSLLILALAPIWLPPVIVVGLRAAWRYRRAIGKLRGRTYLLWHARRGWYDFTRNNVLPVLPANVEPIQDRAHSGANLRALRRAGQRSTKSGALSHPALVLVGHKRIAVVSLNAPLLRHKTCARRDLSVQADVRTILLRYVENAALSLTRSEQGLARASDVAE